jgi:hypothetical protein
VKANPEGWDHAVQSNPKGWGQAVESNPGGGFMLWSQTLRVTNALKSILRDGHAEESNSDGSAMLWSPGWDIRRSPNLWGGHHHGVEP